MTSILKENDAENNEQMKEIVKETEKKVAKILKLIKNNGPDKKGKNPEDKKKSELIFLVEDFHKQYRSLCVNYDRLKEEVIRKKSRLRIENESPMSGSGSDSEFYSPREIEEGLFMNEQYGADENGRKGSSKQPGKEDSNLDSMNDGMKRGQKSKVDEPNGGFSAQIKELEGQLTMTKIELESTRDQMKGLEEKLEKKTTEVKQIGEKNSLLKSRVSELEIHSKRKGDEISTILKKLKDKENKMASKNKELTAQVNNLQLEVESLRAQKKNSELETQNEFPAQIKGLKDRVDAMKQELHSLRNLKNELELQLDLKSKEVAQKAVEIEYLKEEIERNTMTEQVNEHVPEEPEHSVHGGNTKLEELVIRKNEDTEQLLEETEKLEVKVSELEEKLTEKENELSECRRNCEKLITETKQNQIQVENEIVNLKSKITEQAQILTDRDEKIRKLNEESKQSKNNSMDFSPRYRSLDSSKLTQHAADRKIEELAERFEMKMENHIKILYRRIQVAEQIQAETKDCYILAKNKLQDDKNELDRKVEAWESEVENLRTMLTKPSGINVLTGLDIMARKLDKDNGDFLNRISRISNELQFARTWITDTNSEMKQLHENVSMLTTKLEEKEEKLMKLERMEKEGSIKLASKVEELEGKIKGKDEMLVGLGEEKKEAIRQLCLLIEYHRERYHQLKHDAIMKRSI